MPTLEPGETVLRTGPVVWVGGPQGPRRGVLSVTNHALLFEASGPPLSPPTLAGATGSGPPREVRIGLWRCRRATVSSGPRGPVVEVELLARRVFFRVEEPAIWIETINRARATAPPPPPGAIGPGGGRPGAARAAMPRCDYCGRLSAGTAIRCESCGAPF
jgi:hypothetical protein